jgi:CBS domain-containing protein
VTKVPAGTADRPWADRLPTSKLEGKPATGTRRHEVSEHTAQQCQPPLAAPLIHERNGVDVTPDDAVIRILARSPVYVFLDDTLASVADIMTEESIGAALVHGPGGPVGIVSERDVVSAMARGTDVELERARDVMTPDLATIDHLDTIRHAADIMLADEIRHLPVTKDATTIGLVSIRDVLAVFVGR